MGRRSALLSWGICFYFFHFMATAQPANLTEAAIHDMIRQDINEVQQLGQEFAANFLTDLAPLLALFGDQVVRQFMAQSQDWADHIIFAMGPLGIATALLGAVRMGGQRFLRGVIGRGRESRQMAECELTYATAEDVQEVWDGESIARVVGGKTFEQVRLQLEDGQVLIKPLFQDMMVQDTQSHWKRDWDSERHPKINHVQSEAQMGPNLSLNAVVNKDISTHKKRFAAVTSIFLQCFVLSWAGLVHYKLPGPKFRKDGKMGEIQAYAFPCLAVGTVALTLSMLMCSYVVDKTMERKFFRPRPTVSRNKNQPCIDKDMKWRPCWIQKGDTVGDQLVNGYVIFGSLRSSQNPHDTLMTLHPRRQQLSVNPVLLQRHPFGERDIPIFILSLTNLAIILGILGFFTQVVGLRAMHWSVSAAQLGQTLAMVLLRAYVRRSVNAEDVIAMKLPQGFELEWLTTRRGKLWDMLEARESGPRQKILSYVHEADFWGPNPRPSTDEWTITTGEKIDRGEDIRQERGSLTLGGLLESFDHDEIRQHEVQLGNVGGEWGMRESVVQREISDMKSLRSQGKQSWKGTTGLAISNALTKAMVASLNNLLPLNAMNHHLSASVSNGLVQSANTTSWLSGSARLWHWPIVVRVNRRGGIYDQDIAVLEAEPPRQAYEETVRLPLIEKRTGGWLVMEEDIEYLLTSWCSMLEQRQRRMRRLPIDRPRFLSGYIRLIGSNSPQTRWEALKWCSSDCSPVYEGNVMYLEFAPARSDEVEIPLGNGLGQVMGVEAVDMDEDVRDVEPRLVSNGPDHVSRSVPAALVANGHIFRGRELPSNLDDYQLQGDRNQRYRSLATRIDCSLEMLCAQELLFRLLLAIGTFMKENNIQILGETTICSQNIHFLNIERMADLSLQRGQRADSIKFRNSILENIAIEAHRSGICDSLEKAYQCIIPPLSQTGVLPDIDQVIIAKVARLSRKHIEQDEWLKAADLYTWMWSFLGCKFRHRSDRELYVIALFTEFVRKLRQQVSSGTHGESRTKQLAARGELMLTTITQGEFSGRHVVRALGWMLHKLEDLDPVMGAQLVDGWDSSDVEHLLPYLGFTDSHNAAVGLSDYNPVLLRRTRGDILQRRPMHYAASNTALEGSILKFMLQVEASDVDERDINGNTPLHMAASKGNTQFINALKELSLMDDEEVRGKSRVDYNATNELHWTPLHVSAHKGHKMFVNELLKACAAIDINANDIYKRTPLL